MDKLFGIAPDNYAAWNGTMYVDRSSEPMTVEQIGKMMDKLVALAREPPRPMREYVSPDEYKRRLKEIEDG